MIAILTFLAVLAQGPASSPMGVWQTVDDRTHKPRGTVQLYEQDGAVFGRILSTVNPKEAAALCIKCTDERRDKPVVGMVFLRDMRGEKGEYSGGDILDPETGSVYRCKMKLEDGGRKLVVRGFIGISLLGRSQTWTRRE